MTSAMRAVADPAGPRVLRVGLVQGGRVIEERVIGARGDLTVGTAEACQFVVAGPGVPRHFRLLELRGGEVVLHLLEGMRGRVAGAAGVHDVAELARTGERARGGAAEVTTTRLSGDARGRIVLGDATLLFQLVPAPAAAARAPLPASLDRPLEIDWTTTIVAAFSFLFHFGSVGTVFADWMDPVVDDAVDVAGLVQAIEGLPTPPAVETPSDGPEATPTGAPTSAPRDAPKAPPASDGPTRADPSGPERVGEIRAHAIARQLAELDVQMTGTLAGGARATDAVLRRGDEAVLGRLEEAAASAAGAAPRGAGELRGASAGAPVGRVGAPNGSLASVVATAAAAPSGTGATGPVKGPTASAIPGPPSIVGSALPGAASVVAAMSPGFRRCYQRGLLEDATMRGSVRIAARIGPNGEVQAATPSGGAGLSSGVVACVAARVSSAQFDRPEGGFATVIIPVTFLPQ
jgi:hypothetical protein